MFYLLYNSFLVSTCKLRHGCLKTRSTDTMDINSNIVLKKYNFSSQNLFGNQSGNQPELDNAI